MLTSDTMRFCTDIFGFTEEPDEEPEIIEEPTQTIINPGTDDEQVTTEEPTVVAAFDKQALLVAKTAWDCTSKSEVTGITVTGAEPTGTKRRILFKIDDKIYKYSNGALNEWNYELTAKNVLKYGNTATGLAAISGFPVFVGKKIYPIIALQAPSTADDFPSIKLALKTKVSNDTITKTSESIVYELVDEDLPRITEITAEKTLIGAGTVDIKVRLRGDNEVWTSYMNLSDAADKEADAVQFKFTYKVTTTDGTDSAKVESITVCHTLGETVVTGDNAELYSIVQDYEIPLQTCYVVVRHEPLFDATLDCYVNFMREPKKRELIEIGTTTGSNQELLLGVGGVRDTNINAGSIELYVDGQLITDFSYNSETSTVVISAKRGYSIYASYEYNHGTENWLKMTQDISEPYLDEAGCYATRFTYVLPDSDATDKKISNIRIVMNKKTGSGSKTLTKGTGRKQMYVLKHFAKPSTIKMNPACDFTYNEDTRILTYVATKNSTPTVSYSWQGKAPVIHSWSAGFAAS